MPDETHHSTPPLRLPPREAKSHKGDYGRALVIGGSRGMSGSISLAGKATLRSGAGLVTLAVPRTIQDVVAGFEPSYMTVGLADDGQHIAAGDVNRLIELAVSHTALALGPGLGRATDLVAVVSGLYHSVGQPLVVDADGLFALAQRPGDWATPRGPRVLTPHAGEFARLVADDELADLANGGDDERTRAATSLARHDPAGHTVVVLKGHRTVIADTEQAAINETGNPGMATGGTGDVLTGVITGLLCQGLSPFDAARLGVYVHGLAGDLAATELGQVSLIASDLLSYLPQALRQVE